MVGERSGGVQVLPTVIVAVSLHPLLLVHVMVYVPATLNDVTEVVGLVGVVMLAVPGPVMLHVPVPVAAIVAVPVLKQVTVWSAPASGVVSCAAILNGDEAAEVQLPLLTVTV